MGDFGLLKPICLFEQFFHHKVRLSDVPHDKFADFTCATNIIRTAEGSAMVTVGDTRVVCGIKVKVLPGLPDETTSFFTCNVEHLGLAFRGQRTNQGPSKELQALSVQLEWLISNVVLPNASNQLQIFAEGDAKSPSGVYLLHIDIGILLDNGCLLDACLASVIAALGTASWPRLIAVPQPQEDSNSVPNAPKVEFKEKVPRELVRLTISERPVALSFALVPQSPPENSFALISQPSRMESQLWDTDASPCYIVIDSKNDIVDFSLIGGSFCSPLWRHVQDGSSGDIGKGFIQEIIDRASKQAAVIRQEIAKFTNGCK